MNKHGKHLLRALTDISMELIKSESIWPVTMESYADK